MLKSVPDNATRQQMCEVYLHNWNYVKQENTEDRKYVTQAQWEQWEAYRNMQDRKIQEAFDTDDLDIVCSVLRDVNHAIGQAQRDNFIEKKVLEVEKKKNKPVLNVLKSIFLGQKSLK